MALLPVLSSSHIIAHHKSHPEVWPQPHQWSYITKPTLPWTVQAKASGANRAASTITLMPQSCQRLLARLASPQLKRWRAPASRVVSLWTHLWMIPQRMRLRGSMAAWPASDQAWLMHWSETLGEEETAWLWPKSRTIARLWVRSGGAYRIRTSIKVSGADYSPKCPIRRPMTLVDWKTCHTWIQQASLHCT